MGVAEKSVSDHIADMTGGRPALRRFGPLWWVVSALGLLVALALAVFSGLIVPAGCNAGASLLGDLGTSPEELGFCGARSGWRRTLLTGLALGAAAALAFSIAVVAAGVARGRSAALGSGLTRELQSGWWAALARTALVGGWLLLAGWLVAQAAIGLLGDYNGA